MVPRSGPDREPKSGILEEVALMCLREEEC